MQEVCINGGASPRLHSLRISERATRDAIIIAGLLCLSSYKEIIADTPWRAGKKNVCCCGGSIYTYIVNAVITATTIGANCFRYVVWCALICVLGGCVDNNIMRLRRSGWAVFDDVRRLHQCGGWWPNCYVYYLRIKYTHIAHPLWGSRTHIITKWFIGFANLCCSLAKANWLSSSDPSWQRVFYLTDQLPPDELYRCWTITSAGLCWNTAIYNLKWGILQRSKEFRIHVFFCLVV